MIRSFEEIHLTMLDKYSKRRSDLGTCSVTREDKDRAGIVDSSSWVLLESEMKEEEKESRKVRTQKKIRYYLGIFPKWRTPPPFGNPLFKKKISVYFAFFTKKLNFCQYFYIYFWE